MSSDDEEEDRETVLKIVVCGDGSAGKTSICTRFASDNFDRQYHQTLGLDFYSRRITLVKSLQPYSTVTVLLQVWDIGGQSIAGEMVDKYLYGAHAALIVYDVTNQNSFDNAIDWLTVVKRASKTQEKLPNIYLVGNKTDMESKRSVSVDKHTVMAQKHEMRPFYMSAKSGDSVQMVFRQVAADYLGIAMTKPDQDADLVIVQGEVSHDAKEVRKRNVDQSRNTAVCSLM